MLHLRSASLTADQLGRLVRRVTDAGDWPATVAFTNDRRWYQRLELTQTYEIWLLAWLPGQHTGFHDHGDARGAFAVVRGELRESLATPGGRRARDRTARRGSVTTFGPHHVHNVGNYSGAPAVSVHAYAPPLAAMRRYEMTPSGLALVRTDLAERDW